MENKQEEERKRKVSFAPEPQVITIYKGNNENGSSNTESFESFQEEASMEMTTDYLRFSGEEEINVLEKQDNKKFLDAGLEELFSKDVNEEYTQIEIPECDSQSSAIYIPESSAVIDKIDKSEVDNTMVDDEILSNNTINVEDIINTVDLRKIIPQENKEFINVTNALLMRGIRFMDNLVTSNPRRDTMSKSKNEVLPENIRYYENWLDQRTTFLQDFSEDIEKKMEEMNKVALDLEKNFNFKGTLLENEEKINELKKLKSECRSIAKIDWYEYRKRKEVEFNEKILNSKNKLITEINNLENKNQRNIQLLNCKKEENDRKEYEMSRAKEIICAKGDLDSENIDFKIRQLKHTLEEQNDVIESLKSELQVLKIAKANKETERRVLNESIDLVFKEIVDLEKTLQSRNVTEAQLKEKRQQYKTISALFDFDFIKINSSDISFKLLGYTFCIEFDTSGLVINGTVEVNNKGNYLSLLSFGKTQFKCNNMSFGDAFKLIMKISGMVYMLERELNYLKSKYEVECFLREEKIFIEIVLVNVIKCQRSALMGVIDNDFKIELIFEGKSEKYNLLDTPGVFCKTLNKIYHTQMNN